MYMDRAVVKPRTEMMKKSLLYKGAVTWNNMPIDRHHVDTYKQFKETQNIAFQEHFVTWLISANWLLYQWFLPIVKHLWILVIVTRIFMYHLISSFMSPHTE